MGKIFAISGCTNSGKTTLAEAIKNQIGVEKVKIINQDDYFLQSDQVEKLYMTVDGKDVTERGFFYSYDEKESIDAVKFLNDIKEAGNSFEVVVIEGNMLTEFDDIIALCTKIVVLTLDFKICKERRDQRVYDPPDDIGYFEYVAWPAYQRHIKRAFQKSRTDNRFTFLDVSNPFDKTIEKSIMNTLQKIMNYHIRITQNSLNIDDVQKQATSSTCGAISLFVGTTRDNFEGKGVLKLSYECYDEMTYKELHKICLNVQKEIPSIQKIVIHHRIGEVPIAEASVIIATSSPHRLESIRATELIINQLKKMAPIWKKEIYDDNESTWKNNNLVNNSNPSNVEETKRIGDNLIDFLK